MLSTLYELESLNPERKNRLSRNKKTEPSVAWCQILEVVEMMSNNSNNYLVIKNININELKIVKCSSQCSTLNKQYRNKIWMVK